MMKVLEIQQLLIYKGPLNSYNNKELIILKILVIG